MSRDGAHPDTHGAIPTRGILFVVSSPSGAGKTTLCHRLMAEFARLTFSVSYTTRPKRPNERDGVDYHFVDDETFARMVAEEQFAEWAHVHAHRYGTARRSITDNVDLGRDVLFDIDWQGATQLHTKYPDDTVMVFVLPPSLEELARRLRTRATDSEEIVARRLAKATEELGHYGEYDYLVDNTDLEEAYREISAIYRAALCTPKRRAHYALRLLEQARG